MPRSLQVAVFLASSTISPRVFIYPFHTDFAMLDTYFQQNFRASVAVFGFDLLVRNLMADQEAGIDVVVMHSVLLYPSYTPTVTAPSRSCLPARRTMPLVAYSALSSRSCRYSALLHPLRPALSPVLLRCSRSSTTVVLTQSDVFYYLFSFNFYALVPWGL